jgi:hypothetical protein
MNQDFRDRLAEFNARGVEYIVVGAQALASHGLVRATKVLDVWVRPDLASATRVMAPLGAPWNDLTAADMATAGTTFQIGVAPIRIDIITSVDGLAFEDAWASRIRAPFADQVVPVLAREDLIRNKRAAGRARDCR